MKKIGAKVAYIALGILSFFGIWPASATSIPQPQATQLNEVKNTTPLYLKHSADMIPKMSQEKDLTLARHWNHYSYLITGVKIMLARSRRWLGAVL